jgi:TRAP-type C4-dicarboxylate transport system permease small subunit
MVNVEKNGGILMFEKTFGVLKTIGAALLAAMTLLAGFAVLWRFLADTLGLSSASMFWINEAQQLILPWLIVIGLISAFVGNGQLNITIIYDKLNPKHKKSLNRLFSIFNLIIFGTILIWGQLLVIMEIDSRTPALNFSRGLFVYFPYVILAAFVCIFEIRNLYRSFKKDQKNERRI